MTMTPEGKPRFFSSIGMKMLGVASLLLVLSFALCSISLMALTRRMLRENLEATVSRDSRLLGSISEGVLPNVTPAGKERLTQLARDLLKQPEILAIAVLDGHRKI